MQPIQGVYINRSEYEMAFEKPGASAFYFLFDGFIQRFSNLFYLTRIESDTFNYPDEAYSNDDAEKAHFSKLSEGYEKVVKPRGPLQEDFCQSVIANGKKFNEVARYMRSDWMVIWVFPRRFTEETSLLNFEAGLFKIENLNLFVEKNEISVFHNFDGSCWEFYSKNPAMIEGIKIEMKKKGVRYLVSTEFPKMEALYSSDPSYLEIFHEDNSPGK